MNTELSKLLKCFVTRLYGIMLAPDGYKFTFQGHHHRHGHGAGGIGAAFGNFAGAVLNEIAHAAARQDVWLMVISHCCDNFTCNNFFQSHI